MAHTYPIIVNNAIVENNVLGFAVASRTGGNMWGGFGIANLNDDRGYILYSTFFDLTNFDTLSWSKSGSVSQQMWLQNESGQNVATLIDYTNHSNTNATPFNCSNLSGMYRFALYTNTSSSGSSSWSASVRLDSLYVSDNRWYVDAYSNPSDTSTFSGLGSYTDNADVSLQANPIGGYGLVNWKLKGYTRLEYIESSGTQYIDTGLTTNEYKFKTSIYITDWINGYSSQDCYFFGGYNNTRNYFVVYQGKWNIGGTSDVLSTKSATLKTWYDIECSNIQGNQYIKVDDEIVVTSTETHANTPIRIFSVNGLNVSSKCRLKNIEIYDVNNTLVRDYIPCLRHSDGKIGLLDLVELKFYTNSGSGEFVGDVPFEYDERFERLEYIKSSGSQYIDTSIPQNIIGGLEVDFENTSTSVDYARVFGHSGANGYFAMMGGTSLTSYNINNANYDGFISGRNNIQMNCANKKVYVNGVEKGNYAFQTNTTTLWLFRGYDRYSNLSIYNFKVYDTNNNLIADFVPSRKKDDGVLGLFDMVNNEFYTNNGSGTFIGGNVL